MHLCRLYLPVLFSVTVCSLLLKTSATQLEEKEHEKLKRHDEAGMEGENNEESKNEIDQSGTCPTCGKEDITAEEAKLLRIEMFKQTLIDELHLDPNNLHTSESDRKTFRFDIPKLPSSLRDHMQQNVPVHDNRNAKVLEIIIPGTYMGNECIKRHAIGCATFDLKNKIQGDISGAELWLYMMEDHNDTAALTLDVYELNKTSGESTRIKSVVSPKEFFVKEGWLYMNMTGAVKQWLEEGRDNPLLTFNCTTCKTWSYKTLYGIKSDYKPLLVVRFARKYLPRRDKRSENDCNPRFSCCKFDYRIKFFDIGRTDVLMPVSINVGYCHGSCSGRDQYTTNHTAVIQHVRANNPSKYAHLRPCCVPVGSLLPFSVLKMMSGGMIQQYVMSNVLVYECGCA